MENIKNNIKYMDEYKHNVNMLIISIDYLAENRNLKYRFYRFAEETRNKVFLNTIQHNIYCFRLISHHFNDLNIVDICNELNFNSIDQYNIKLEELCHKNIHICAFDFFNSLLNLIRKYKSYMPELSSTLLLDDDDDGCCC